MAATALQKCDQTESLPRATARTAKLQDCLLLIDDNEEAMTLVRAALEEFADGIYRLEWAINLNEGLNRLSRGGVDVVLLDLGLPESSGSESFAWVREIAPRTPVVVLTADDSEETEFAVKAGGPEGYLVKHQVSGSMLVDAVKAALSAAGQAIDQPATPQKLSRPLFRLDEQSNRKRTHPERRRTNRGSTLL